MHLSVVVPTLNGREQLGRALDALAEDAPDAEVVVVNGPSSDGTTGMVREREDVDVLVEISERNLNVARNAGAQVASGDVVAFLRYDLVVEAGWADAIETAIEGGSDVVTGPTHRSVRAGVTTEARETWTVGGREVTFVNGDNGAFTRAALEAVDGFDEYLETGGSRDVSHRVAANDFEVAWDAGVCVRGEVHADGGRAPADWGSKYRSLAYRLSKNYGVRPSPVYHTAKTAIVDGARALRDVVGGASTPSVWLENGKRVFSGIAVGTKDGLAARKRAAAGSQNPNGLSSRADRAVTKYEQ
ncbi:glycosyltransferase [Halorubellus sp. JP-L1]|uniref:glycosyltransferase family 2 protein n=1 Tax=Halorubellus sp. JP-L1 TaxID=2715753 RepID=UPI00140D46E0|nr:glycosyltransferase [Halorubellus sp. JP-L1]NHN42371.1 glycosyltransferase [Halorubellus sp. JP-L1]